MSLNKYLTKYISASSVLRLEMISNGVAEAGPSLNIYSRLHVNDETITFKDPGIYFTLYDIKTGKFLLKSDLPFS